MTLRLTLGGFKRSFGRSFKRSMVEWGCSLGLATAFGLSLFSPACGGSAFETSSDGASGTGNEGGGSGTASAASGTGGAQGATASSSTGTTSTSGSTSSGTTGSGTSGSGSTGSGSTGSGSTGSGGSTSGAGGGSSTSQWAEDYEQSCGNDDECELVLEGDACACPGCPNASVNRGAVEKYQSDWEAIECPPGSIDIVCPAVLCVVKLAACTAMGLCTARDPLYIEAENYERSCENEEDCRVIPTGEACSSCQCTFSAVNQRGYEQYVEDLEGVDCTPGPSVCDCAGPGSAHCAREGTELGVCSAG
ncbi:MAG TPA: hypothetical protein VF989_17235 [Polyangiaceae bacterium]